DPEERSRAHEVKLSAEGTYQVSSCSQSQFSMLCLIRLRNRTAVEPSNARWSQVRPRWPMWRMAIMSSPSGPVTTAGRLVIVSVDRIATLGTLMIGADISDPNGPGLVIVNVAPVTSSGVSLLDRARLANSEIWRARPTKIGRASCREGEEIEGAGDA